VRTLLERGHKDKALAEAIHLARLAAIAEALWSFRASHRR
jgi:hypothetical protein